MNTYILFTFLKYFIICEQTCAATNINEFTYVLLDIFIRAYFPNIKYSFFQSYFREIKRDFEFEKLAVDLAYKWKDVTCLNIILDRFHDGILDELFYKAVTGIPFFKVSITTYLARKIK